VSLIRHFAGPGVLTFVFSFSLTGFAAAPPSSDINARRLMGRPSGSGLHITTPLRKNAAVHHSKNCALMSQMGQNAKNSH
jgi:hypothetical protein